MLHTVHTAPHLLLPTAVPVPQGKQLKFRDEVLVKGHIRATGRSEDLTPKPAHVTDPWLPTWASPESRRVKEGVRDTHTTHRARDRRGPASLETHPAGMSGGAP